MSSTAHLAALPILFGWNHPLLTSQAFDAVLHLGTLGAVLAVFGREWLKLVPALARPRSPEGKFGWGLVVATLPALAAGAAFEHVIGDRLRTTAAIAGFVAAGAAILWAADSRRPGGRSARAIGWNGAIVVGCAQALAVFPGLSRSGMTIAAGLFLGLSRTEAAHYAFLLSAPVIAAAGLWEARHLSGLTGDEFAVLSAGLAVAAFTGAVSIRWFLRVVSRIGLLPFAVYRFLLALVLLAR